MEKKIRHLREGEKMITMRFNEVEVNMLNEIKEYIKNNSNWNPGIAPKTSEVLRAAMYLMRSKMPNK